MTFLEDPSGTANDGQDYDNFPESVNIEAGQNYIDFEVDVNDDGDIEPHETLIAEVKPDSSNIYKLNNNSKATASITDNDVLIVLISGHGQGDPDDESKPAPGAGVWSIRDELIDRDFHPDNIAMYAEGAGGIFGQSVAVANIIVEIASAIHDAGDRTLGLAMAGYSHGAGVLFDVSNELAEKYQFWAGKYDFNFAGYIDGISKPLAFPLNQRPVGVGYLMNYFQNIPNAPDFLAGTSIAAADAFHNFDAAADSETHISIDKETKVHEDFAEVIDARLG